ncbi:MAG: hypothetical protein JO040_04540 [Gemmatimonadetes bacterium]|nr:hypothetical protein [Gemmatimonadota bacterium]
MQVDIAGGRVEFRRHIAVPAQGPVPDGVDAPPGALQSPVNVDQQELAGGFVSLASPNVRIAAMELTITALGRIRKVGWVNVIVESTRLYHYGDGMIVTESVDGLPTWDGGENDARPFYFGAWFGTDEGDADEDGCAEVLQVNGPIDVILNDAPCMPPSYDVRQHNGIPLGKFNVSPPGYLPNRITRVSGRDRYLACLVVVDDADAHHIAWSVPWDVTYDAQVTAAHDGSPQVALDPGSLTRLNMGGPYNAGALVNQVVVRQAGETLKRYTRNREARLVRDPGLLQRTKSTGDLRNRPF